jgi:hypothetical protein
MLPQGGTFNHVWNAPNTILSKHIAGITPTKPGWSEYQVLLNIERFTQLKQVVPSVKGDISVKINRTDKCYAMKLVSPEGTTAIVGIPKASITPNIIEAPSRSCQPTRASPRTVPLESLPPLSFGHPTPPQRIFRRSNAVLAVDVHLLVKMINITERFFAAMGHQIDTFHPLGRR